MENVRKKVWQRIMIIPVLFAMLLSFIPLSQSHAAYYNNEVKFSSNIVYMESLDEGTVIFSKNANEKTAMASLTKITTAMVVLNNVKDLDIKITVPQAPMDSIAGTNSSTAGITVGEVLTVRQLLNLMLVHSANEAAAILAYYVGGNDIDTFVGMMNSYAKKLGCKNTHYTNPHGLDESGHYTTANDLALIIKDALKNSTFKKIVSQSSYTLAKTNKRDSVTYPSTNYLLNSGSSYYYEGCRGIKTGTTENAGHCLASYTTSNGYTYLCIVIEGAKTYAKNEAAGTTNDNIAFDDTIKAYDWVFKNIKLKVVAGPNEVVTDVPVALGRSADHVQLVPSEDVTALLPSNVDASGVSIEPIESSISKDIRAPIHKGDKLGKAKVVYAGSTLCTIDLVANEDIHQSFFGSIGYYLKKFFSYKVVKIILVLFLIFLLIWLLVNLLYRRKKRAGNIHLVRVYHDSKGEKPIRTITSDGKTSRQPTYKRSKPGKRPRKRGGRRNTRRR